MKWLKSCFTHFSPVSQKSFLTHSGSKIGNLFYNKILCSDNLLSKHTETPTQHPNLVSLYISPLSHMPESKKKKAPAKASTTCKEPVKIRAKREKVAAQKVTSPEPSPKPELQLDPLEEKIEVE